MFYVFLALIAIGYGAGFIISFITKIILSIFSSTIENKTDTGLTIGVIISLVARIIWGSGFDISFMLTIGISSVLGFHVFIWISKKQI